jgi:hypothetical protein
MFSRRWLTAGLALLVGGGLAAAIPGLAAVGQSAPPSSPVLLQSPAKILSKGAAAQVTVLVVCQPFDSFTSLNVSLTEKSGNGIASGSAFLQPVPCSGEIETLRIPVTATGKPFVKGTAFGEAAFQDCNFFGCPTSTDSRSVKLTDR